MQPEALTNMEFWDFLDRLAAEHRVVIDRPAGSAHPRYPTLIYPLDYGYLEDTTTVDGDGLDVWVGSLPERRLDALALTVDLHKRDAELKLLLGCTQAEKAVILDFLNGNSMRASLVPRPPVYQQPSSAVQPDPVQASCPGVLAFLASRRSVRRFRPEPVPRAMVERILQTATRAPSAHNRQPWRFAVLTGVEARRRLAQALAADFARDLQADGLSAEDVAAQVGRSQTRIGEAPVVVLLCLDLNTGDVYPDLRRQQAETMLGVQSAALAGGTLLLAAHAEGLGGVWMCAPLFAPQAARQALGLPAAWQPQALILLGYPAQVPPERERKTLEEVAWFFE